MQDKKTVVEVVVTADVEINYNKSLSSRASVGQSPGI
jgi:hypothetical protein